MAGLTDPQRFYASACWLFPYAPKPHSKCSFHATYCQKIQALCLCGSNYCCSPSASHYCFQCVTRKAFRVGKRWWHSAPVPPHSPPSAQNTALNARPMTVSAPAATPASCMSSSRKRHRVQLKPKQELMKNFC